MDPSSPSAATNSAASLYALLGVMGAAFVTAIGAVITAVVGKRRERSLLDANPNDVEFMTKAYSDCRTDLEHLKKEIARLESELDEARDLVEHLMRELRGR